MSFPEETPSNQNKPYSELNSAFLDFSQDFNQKYLSHHLMDFSEENEMNPFVNLPKTNCISQENHQDIDVHQGGNSIMFNGFDYKEKPGSKSLNSNIRLDCSPEMKIGVKGSSRFFSFDPEDDGLNSYWGGKNGMNTMSNMNMTHFDDMNNEEVNHDEDHNTFMHNGNEVQFERNENEAFMDKESGNRSSRGLRVLSLKVKEIVCEKKETTYKEVAETLVQELNIKDVDMGKDEQNVKRRVYDALNVLIAADVLKKRGKNVLSDQNSSLSGKSLNSNGRYERGNYEEIKKKMNDNLRVKTEKLRDIINKTIGLQYLIKRNKSNPIKIEENHQVLNFPFIILENLSSDQIKFVTSKEKQDLAVFFKKSFGIYGDMDVLIKLGFHIKGKDISKSIIEEAGAQKFL